MPVITVFDCIVVVCTVRLLTVLAAGAGSRLVHKRVVLELFPAVTFWAFCIEWTATLCIFHNGLFLAPVWAVVLFKARRIASVVLHVVCIDTDTAVVSFI